MRSKGLKIAALVITAATFAFFVYLIFFDKHKVNPALIYQMLGGKNINLSPGEKFKGILTIFGIPVTLLITYILRAVDNDRNYLEGEKVWAAGLAYGVAVYWLMYYAFASEDNLFHAIVTVSFGLSKAYTEVMLGFFLLIGTAICLIGAFKRYDGSVPKPPGPDNFLDIAADWTRKH